MYKIRKKASGAAKPPALYNIIEDFSEFDPPGNVWVCAMTGPENVETHANVLAESYAMPVEIMRRLLDEGGVHVYPQDGLLVTRGAWVCRLGKVGETPKMTWALDVEQYAQAEQLRLAYGLLLDEAAWRVFERTLPPELRERLEKKNLGLDFTRLDREIAKRGDIAYIDFRKDWSPHFKRLCIMPDGTLVETSGIEDFARLHKITAAQARTLIEQGGTLDVDGEVLACQIVNGQPSVARFNRAQYARAKELAAERRCHLLDALSEVGLSDPVMMRALKRREKPYA
ncbi:MAG: hypothetical protein ACKOBZ_01240 [Nitrospira sp.]|nr:hypothetical protein [Nitrospira sp.]